ncbi:hypothetical protein QUC32_02855 [Novosphingobium resinovorum]|uniref:hypothetical protein n=1 Tax=Novosphingobium TaxID=165696 RepID=UPI001B3C8EA4|nr:MULTISPECIES: hypothetical protein [Novosphingobium]MBF7013774.1 hypothetical protein [Novosphingobium sp. HR1a]WJM25916.1 hypothetical protein QUC32_02855 [Novosphingobium resinovorum]
MNDHVTTHRRTHNVRKIVIIAIALLAMFLIALAVGSTSIGVLHRPGADPGPLMRAEPRRIDMVLRRAGTGSLLIS